MRSTSKVLKQYLSADALIKNRESRVTLYTNAILTGIVKLPSVIKILRKQYVFFPQVEIALTTRCSLRCKDCSNLMQYYDKPYDIDLETNLKSIRNFLDNVDLVDRFILLGGEPFLYKEIGTVIKEILAYGDKVKRIWIYTNGTIVPTDEYVIKILKNEKIKIHISNYGELSRKKKELVALLEGEKINYNLAEEDANWYSMGGLEKRGRSKKQLVDQFDRCNGYCNNIMKGKLCYCARSSGAVDLGIVKNEKFVDLLLGGIREKLAHFVYDYIDYLETCDYCDKGTDEAFPIKKAIQMSKQIK